MGDFLKLGTVQYSYLWDYCLEDSLGEMKIVFDVANASMLESVTPALDLVKDHLAHVHLSDTDGMKWTHLPIGMGTVDFALIAEKLKEMHFSGVSILETTHAENPKWGIVSSVEKLTTLGWRMDI